MKKRIKISFFVLALFLSFGTIYMILQKNKHNSAQNGLQSIINELSSIPNTQIVDSFNHQFHGPIEGCLYERSYIAIATSQAKEQAFPIYVKSLMSLGWVFQGIQHEKNNTFVRNQHEYLSLSYEPGPLDSDYLDYNKLRSQYSSIFSVMVDYVIPSTTDC